MGGQGSDLGPQRGAVPGRVRALGRALDWGVHMPGQDVLVIGLGYVGLPLAIQAARSGFRVTGLDIHPESVAGLLAGRSHVDDVTDAEVAEMLSHGFRATTDEAEL